MQGPCPSRPGRQQIHTAEPLQSARLRGRWRYQLLGTGQYRLFGTPVPKSRSRQVSWTGGGAILDLAQIQPILVLVSCSFLFGCTVFLSSGHLVRLASASCVSAR